VLAVNQPWGVWYQFMVPATLLLGAYLIMSYLFACPELLDLLNHGKGRWSKLKSKELDKAKGI
jgi:hypothetical protein